LFGVKSRVDSTQLKAPENALLGKVLETFSATECQGRSLLHFHVLVWTTFTPSHLSELARKDYDAACNYLENIVTTTFHDNDAMYKFREKTWANCEQVEPASLMPPEERANGVDIIHTAARFNMHFLHKDSCGKKAQQQIRAGHEPRCRYAFPRPPSETTRLINMLKPVPAGQKQPLRDGEFFDVATQELARQWLPCEHHACVCEDVLARQLVPAAMFLEKRLHQIGRAHSDAINADTGNFARTIEVLRDQVFAEAVLSILRAVMANTNGCALNTPESAVSAAGYICDYACKGEGGPNISGASIVAALHQVGDRPDGPRSVINR
jgi:hypothetical protein